MQKLQNLAVEAYVRYLCTGFGGQQLFIEPFVRQFSHPLRVIVLRTVFDYVRRASSGDINTILSMLASIFERAESYGGVKTVQSLVSKRRYPPDVELAYLQYSEANWWQFVRSNFARDETLWSRINDGYCSLVESVVSVEDILSELDPRIDVIRLLTALRTYPRERAIRQIVEGWAAFKLEYYAEGDFYWCTKCYDQMLINLCMNGMKDCQEICEDDDWETMYEEEYFSDDLLFLLDDHQTNAITPSRELELEERLITTRNPSYAYKFVSGILASHLHYLCVGCRTPVLQFYPAIK